MQSCIIEQATCGLGTQNWLGTWVANEPLPRRHHANLPADLTEWVSGDTVRVWIEQEISRLDWNKPQLAQYLQQHPEYRAKVMLCLLAFAYATRVFSSEEVVRACYSDRMFGLICEGQVPFAHEVRTFRRRNRFLLERILAGVFIRAVTNGLNLNSSLPSCELERELRERAVERLHIAWQFDVEDD